MITTFRNDTFERSWRFHTVEGLPIDVTGATCDFIILDSFDEGNVIFSCSHEDYISIDAENGLFECSVPADVFTLPAGDYVFFCRAVLEPQTTARTLLLEDNHLHVRELPEG